ncbi:MAG: hypothetical protein HFE90_08630 [Firmicutes bacterium]|nr:hypothetical protein [Bacillota bacterium]
MEKNKDFNSNMKNDERNRVSERAAERLQARSFWENYFHSGEGADVGKQPGSRTDGSTDIGIESVNIGDNKKSENKSGEKSVDSSGNKKIKDYVKGGSHIKYDIGHNKEESESMKKNIENMADKYWKIPEGSRLKNVDNFVEKPGEDKRADSELGESRRTYISWESTGGYEDEEYLASVNGAEEADNIKASVQNIFTGIIAAGIIIIICVLNILIPDKDFSEKENRTLTSMPHISYTAIVEGTFASDMESYVTDQFPFRDMWIRLRSSAETTLGKYYANGVYKGSDGYLLEDINEPDHTKLAHKIKDINTFAESNENINVYMLLAPNAANIMKDNLPAYAPVKDQNAYMDSVIFRLSPVVKYIDVRDDFTAEFEAGNQLYYRTDHHWTSYGAFRALFISSAKLGIPVSEELYTKYTLADDFSGTLASKSGFSVSAKDSVETYIPKDNIEYVVEYVEEGEKTASVYRQENLEKADKYAVFFGGNYSQIKINTTVRNDERLIVVKDSYANCFVPMLIPYYSEIIIIDPRYYYGNLYALAEKEGANKVMFLYNANTFFEESSITDLLNSELN